MDKAHGRIDQRTLWSQPVDGATLGLAGARQVFRIDLKSEQLRRGRVVKTTTETSYRVTSLLPEEAGPQALMDEARGYWAIENGQHYRRDHTQREDHCLVRHPQAARTLSLCRSLAIFLYQQQRHRPKGQPFLPDWLKANHRDPNRLLRLFSDPGA